MTIKQFNNIALRFSIKDMCYEIPGLKVNNFSLKNKFLGNNNIKNQTWETQVPASGMHSLSLYLEGDYHACEAQHLLGVTAFNNQELECQISLDGNLVEGSFLINEYEINARFDQFVEFRMMLVNASKIRYILETNN